MVSRIWRTALLQWVHGPRTVVRAAAGESPWNGHRFNGSTAREPWLGTFVALTIERLQRLQWVHGPRTVVRLLLLGALLLLAALQWVHGPRTVVRHLPRVRIVASRVKLQWVHGPRTVVRDNVRQQLDRKWRGFNGSTAREPWLGATPAA